MYYNGMENILEMTCKITHLPLDKMAAILADNIFKLIFFNEKW